MFRNVRRLLLLVVVCIFEKSAFLAAAQELTLDEATAQAVIWFNEADSTSEGSGSSVAQDLRTRAMELLGQVSIASGGKHAAAAFLLGMMRQRTGDAAGALSAYHEAVQADPSNADALNNLGKAMSDLDRDDESLSWYRRAVEVDPTHSRAKLNIALHLAAKNDFTAAIAELHALLAKDPHDNEALYNLGWCQERRGSVLDAANAYTSCLNEAPRRLDARLNLAALHHKHGNIKEAVVQYERILELLTSGSVTADLYDGRQGDRSGGTNEEEGPMDGSVAWEGPSGSEFDDPWLYGDSSGNDEDVDIMHQANRVASLGLESDSSNGHRRQLLKGDDRDMVVMVLGNLGAALGQAGRPRDGARRHRQALALLAEDLMHAQATNASTMANALKREVVGTSRSTADEDAGVAATAAASEGSATVDSLRHQIAHTRVQLMTIRHANCCWRHYDRNLKSLVAYVVQHQLGPASNGLPEAVWAQRKAKSENSTSRSTQETTVPSQPQASSSSCVGAHPSAMLPFETLGSDVSRAFRLVVARLHSTSHDSQYSMANWPPPTPPPPVRTSGLAGARREGAEGSASKPADAAHLLRVGYMSFDFNDHPTTHLVEGLFLHHKNRTGFGSSSDSSDSHNDWSSRAEQGRKSSSRSSSSYGGPLVEALALSYGRADGSTYRAAVEEHAHSFVELAHLGHTEAVLAARRHQPHIMVDLQGPTLGGRSEIASLRVAPVQVNYLIFPGTSGAPWADYLLCDKRVAPPDLAFAYPTTTNADDEGVGVCPEGLRRGGESIYSEKLVYLPNSYQVNYYARHLHTTNDAPSTVSTASAAAGNEALAGNGLSGASFVFANFNKVDKLEPLTFGIWMSVLRRVPGSVLWLLAPSKKVQLARAVEDRLRGEAVAHGVNPRRLVFASRVGKAAHLARHAHAHLFLDTFYYGAHSTATDALRGGLPVLSAPGDSFARRVGASLLHAACGKQPLLLADSLPEFEDLAVQLALGHIQAQDRFWSHAVHNPSLSSSFKPATGSVLSRLRDELPSVNAVVDKEAEGGVVLDGPLFDTALFTRHAERAYALMWELHASAASPMHVAVAPLAGTTSLI